MDIITILRISSELNRLLEEYYARTLALKEVLERIAETDEDIDLEEILGQRGSIIRKYDTLIKDYEQLLKPEVAAMEEIKGLVTKRNEIMSLIRDVETVNIEKVKILHSGYKEKIKHINEGKKAINAYNGGYTSTDGFYFDKRK